MHEPHIAPPACVTEDAFAALMEISKRPPVVFVEGRGSWLTDQEGKKYLDFIQGWAVNCLGHCPTAIVSAIKSQAETRQEIDRMIAILDEVLKEFSP